MLSAKDKNQLALSGISEKQVENQLQYFTKGFPFLTIIAPATVGEGIVSLTSEEQVSCIRSYELFKGSRVKFVPASGAATRMFKQLFEFKEAVKSGGVAAMNSSVSNFFKRIKEFAFYSDLKKVADEHDVDILYLSTDQDYAKVVSLLLDRDGLSYGNLPKAMLKFHQYVGDSRTAIEEHLVEAALYGSSKGQPALLHFTVSPEHREEVEQLLEHLVPAYEQRFRLSYHICLSEQQKSTDTIAVDMNNKLFRNNDGSLLFRPGGHGALIGNLNDLTADLIFIKNIDNVVHEAKVGETVYWKKVLAGLLLCCRDSVYKYLGILDSGIYNAEQLKEVSRFLHQTFSVSIPYSIWELPLAEQAAFLYDKLHRPIRVCGMVKNEGEPGGGPFVIQEADGSTSLQILESSQISLTNAHMKGFLEASTHFNPVDIVCSCYNHKGVKYDLLKYIDPQTGFISEKSKDGRQLKALELPGLWNGAMSRWNTVFVEVPLATFNPVKTVNDLLRNEHRA